MNASMLGATVAPRTARVAAELAPRSPSSKKKARSEVRGYTQKARAFTLTEMLIVIAIIVLLVALAVPALNFITGSRSVEGAYNQISAYLGRARAEAIGLQERRGIMFYLDPATQRVNAIIVHEAPYPVGGTADVYLDVVPDTDALVLPPGIGVQTIDNAEPVGTNDKYLGFNTTLLTPPSSGIFAPYGGVILFNGTGEVVSESYGFLWQSAGNATQIAGLLLPPNTTTPSTVFSNVPSLPPTQLGFALFDRDALRGVASPSDTDLDKNTDPQITGGSYTGSSPSEQTEENWLDQNATVMLLNRYNGTLISAQ